MINDEAMANSKMILTQKILFKLLDKIQYGKIIILDGGNAFVFSGRDNVLTHTVTIFIKNKRAYKTIFFGGSIGAGKGYIQGDWDTDDLNKLLEIFMMNKILFKNIESPIANIVNHITNIRDKFYFNTFTRAKNNILAHYDLGNDFFKLFLDPTMMYSCALYEPENILQEQASRNKLATICNYLKLNSNDHILEIGTGWGGFAIFAALKYGCKVTTTTISDKQYFFVKNEIKRLGLENKIELLNLDYRKLTGQYDKLVSIEMIEAVGHQYFNKFFKQCDNLLKPGGLFFLQAIVMNDQTYERAKNQVDFIKKYIFPGGCLPSVHSILQSTATQTQMQLMLLNDIGNHYVFTLNDWHKNLINNNDLIVEHGYSDEFIRMWKFYFCYCIAGFKTNYISNIHALWRKQV